MELKRLKLKNRQMLIKPPEDGEYQVPGTDKTIWVPERSKAKGVVFGEVVALCPTITDEDLQPGAIVMANRFNTGIEIEYDDERYNLLTPGNVIAIVKKNEELKGKNEYLLIDLPHEEVTRSGLVLSRKATYGHAIRGKIFVAGDKIKDDDMKTIGTTAIFERNSSTEIEYGDKRLHIVDAEDIIGVEE